MGRAASAIAMHSDAGRASMWTLCACWSSFCAAVAGPECRIRRPIVLGDYWDRPTAFGVRGVCVERVYVKTRECAPPRAAPSRSYEDKMEGRATTLQSGSAIAEVP